MSKRVSDYFQRVEMLCSLIQSQERTWILGSTSVQLCNYWQRESRRKETGKVPHKSRPIYLPLFFSEAATIIDL